MVTIVIAGGHSVTMPKSAAEAYQHAEAQQLQPQEPKKLSVHVARQKQTGGTAAPAPAMVSVTMANGRSLMMPKAAADAYARSQERMKASGVDLKMVQVDMGGGKTASMPRTAAIASGKMAAEYPTMMRNWDWTFPLTYIMLYRLQHFSYPFICWPVFVLCLPFNFVFDIIGWACGLAGLLLGPICFLMVFPCCLSNCNNVGQKFCDGLEKSVVWGLRIGRSTMHWLVGLVACFPPF